MTEATEAPASDAVVAVTRNDDEGRYEIHLDDTLAGYTEFRVSPEGKLIFPHTVMDPAFGGRGLGSRLVSEAMADVAAREETVVPLCPFVVKYLRSHDVAGLKVEFRDVQP